jgi:hypothetical protein
METLARHEHALQELDKRQKLNITKICLIHSTILLLILFMLQLSLHNKFVTAATVTNLLTRLYFYYHNNYYIL